jgi:hypothetical protein
MRKRNSGAARGAPKSLQQRPRFKPLWTEEVALRAGNDRCSPDAIDQIGTRLATILLSRTPEELMRCVALPKDADGSHPAVTLLDTLAETLQMTEARLQILRAAQVRVLATACFVHGIKWR